MAKKKRKKRGVQIYHPHSIGTIIYGLFGLLTLALLAGFAFLPMFTVTKSGVDVVEPFKGLDYLIFGVRNYFSSLHMPKFDAFTSYYQNADPNGNELLKIIINFHEYIELGIAAFMVLTLLWAFVEFCLAMGFILFGKSNHPKGVSIFAWLIFWFFAIYIGLSYMYFFFYMQIIQLTGEQVNINLSLPVLAILGAMLVVCIVLFAIHKGYLKDRVAVEKNKKKNKDEDDDDDEEEEEEKEETKSTAPFSAPTPKPIPQPAPEPVVQPDPEPAPQPVLEQKQLISPSGNDVITVGDRAYAKNTELTTASIPEGIVSLGSSAFANCVNLASVTLPASLQDIGFNCFFNTPKLVSIVFNGTVEQWKNIKRGSNWLTKSGTTTVQCADGQINVNPRH